MFLSTYLSLTIPEVDGWGLVSLQSVVLKHRMKEGLPTKNKKNPRKTTHVTYEVISQQQQHIFV